MINKIHSDIFDKDEIQLIFDMIEKELKRRVVVEDESFVNSTEDQYIIKSLSGRIMLEHLPMPLNLLKK